MHNWLSHGESSSRRLAPVGSFAVGHGRRVLDGGDGAQPVELLDVQQSPKGTLFLAYRCPQATT